MVIVASTGKAHRLLVVVNTCVVSGWTKGLTTLSRLLVVTATEACLRLLCGYLEGFYDQVGQV